MIVKYLKTQQSSNQAESGAVIACYCSLSSRCWTGHGSWPGNGHGYYRWPWPWARRRPWRQQQGESHFIYMTMHALQRTRTPPHTHTHTIHTTTDKRPTHARPRRVLSALSHMQRRDEADTHSFWLPRRHPLRKRRGAWPATRATECQTATRRIWRGRREERRAPGTSRVRELETPMPSQ